MNTAGPGVAGPGAARRVVALAAPATITLLADPLLGLIDTAVVGRLGAAELGALGLAVAVFATVSWVCNFLVFGTTSTVARALGSGQRDRAGQHVSHAAQVAVVLGVLISAGLVVTAPLLLRGLGAVDELLAPATTYLRIRALGVPLLLLGYVGHGAFRGVADTRTPLRIVAVATGLNAVLTVWLVHGVGAGIAGAAWATLAAQGLTVGLFAVLAGRTRLTLRGHGRPDRSGLRAMAVVSRDLVLRTGGLLLGLLAVSAAAARDGAETAAAHQVLLQSFLVVSFLMDGVAIAVQSLVGRARGAGDEAEVQALVRIAAVAGFAGGGMLAVLLLAGGGVLPRLLTDDVAVLAAVGTAWWFVALAQLVNAPVFALDGVLMGAEDFAWLRTFTVLGAAVAGIGAQAAVSIGAGILALWIAVEAMMVVRLVSLVVRVRQPGFARAAVG